MKSTIKRMDEEEVLKILSEQAPVGVCIMQDGKFCYFNSNFPLAIGYTIDELVGMDSLEIVVPEDRKMVMENTLQMLKGELLSPYQFRVTCKDGNIIWVMAAVKSIQYHGRRAVLGNYMEVTERKQMEKTLKESEEKYRELANSITDIFFAMDEHLRYTYWNRASEILTGIRADDAIGKSLREIFPDMDWLRRAERVYREVLTTQQSQIFVNDVDLGGRHYIFEISAYPSQGGISVFVRDITERKQTEEEMKQSEERYRTILEEMGDGYFETDLAGNLTFVNDALVNLLGYSREELIGMNYRTFTPEEDMKHLFKAYNSMYKTGEPLVDFSREVIRKDGTHGFAQSSAFPIRNYKGEIIGFRGIRHDITERKQTEKALRQSEEKYRALFDSAVIGALVLDAETMKVVMGNQAAVKMFGFSSAEEATEVNLLDFVPPEDREKDHELLMKEVFEQDSRLAFDLRTVTKDGRKIWISATGARIMHGGRLAGLLSFTDISERKQAEEAIWRSEERYRTILEEMEDAYFEVDLGGHLTFVNNSVCRDLGYSREELIGMSYKGFTIEDDIESVFRVFNEVYRTGVPNKGFPWKTIRKDGVQGFAETSISPLRNDKGEIVGFRGVGRDITERRKIVEALRQSEENYRVLFDSSVIGSVVLDAETMKVVMVNQAALKMFGFSSSEEAFEAEPFDFILPEDKERYLKITKTAVFEHNSHEGYQLRAVTRDGREIWINTTAAKIMHDGGVAALISFTDITEQKQAENALRQSEENYRVLFDSSVIGTIVLDAETLKVAMVNQAAAKMFGFGSAEEVLGLDPLGFIRPEDRERIIGIATKALFEQDSHEVYELGALTKDGREIWINATGSRIMHAGKLAGLISFTDISEERRQREKLVMADRLASLGELASGTAHELNNPLTSIVGFSQLLMEKEVPDDIREDLKLINNEAQRAARVTKNLLTFARKQAPMKQRIHINSIIDDVLRVRAPMNKANGIEVEQQLAPNLPEIMVDYFQMQQVFINIVINAEYFMTEAHNGGTLTVTTKRQNNTVMISFTDDGPGIPPENLSRIFDPFFTTKEAGKGTGLGLSICHGIVAEHGGQIYAKSQLGKGTTIFVELPIKKR